MHATDEEWNKIRMELLQRDVVVEIAREDAPIVDGHPVLVGAFGVEKCGTPIPPATGSQADCERDPEQQTADRNQRRHGDASGRRMAPHCTRNR